MKKLDAERIRAIRLMLVAGFTPTTISQLLGVTRPTVYKYQLEGVKIT